MSNFSQMASESNATAQAEAVDGIYNNVERLLFVNPHALSFHYPVEAIALFIMNYMYTADSLMHQ